MRVVYSVLLVSFAILIHAQTGVKLNEIIFSPHYYDNLEKALQEAENVWYLDLSMQKLKSLPPDIEKLKNLRYLDLSYNHFTSLPEEIARLPKLEVLKISGLYNMPHIPEFIYSMTHLKELYAIDLRVPPQELKRLKEALPNTKVITTLEELHEWEKQKE